MELTLTKTPVDIKTLIQNSDIKQNKEQKITIIK